MPHFLLETKTIEIAIAKKHEILKKRCSGLGGFPDLKGRWRIRAVQEAIAYGLIIQCRMFFQPQGIDS